MQAVTLPLNGLDRWHTCLNLRRGLLRIMDDILGQAPIQQAFPPIPLTPEETPPELLALTSVLLEQNTLPNPSSREALLSV